MKYLIFNIWEQSETIFYSWYGTFIYLFLQDVTISDFKLQLP